MSRRQPRDGRWIFSDQLGYARLAESMVQVGPPRALLSATLAFPYSPLDPAALAPLYAFHLSAPEAYHWSKIVNCVLLALAAIPIYGIARFALSRAGARRSRPRCARSRPLCSTRLHDLRSQTLAYPLFLCAVWTMLVAVRSPSGRHDALLLVTIVLACAARLEFILLVPAALGAVRPRRGRRADRAGRSRPPPPGGGAAAPPAAHGCHRGPARRRRGGRRRYRRRVRRRPLPERSHGVASLSRSGSCSSEIEHLAEFHLAVGVIPFRGRPRGGLRVAPARRDAPPRHLRGRRVSKMTFFCSSRQPSSPITSSPPVEVRRIHERYLVYLVPFFVIALLALGRRARWPAPRTAYLMAVLVAGAAARGDPVCRMW